MKVDEPDKPKFCGQCGKGPDFIEWVNNNVFLCKCGTVITTGVKTGEKKP